MGTRAALAAKGEKSLPMVQAYPADSFVDSIGVVTHLTYTDTPYFTAWPQIFGALQTLGVRHIRDGYYDWAENSPFIAEHRQLASAEIKTDYVVPFNPSTTPQNMEEFSPKVRDMEALEGPNECDVAGNCGATAALSIGNMLGFLPPIDAAGKSLGV